jgi:hypothetical protein
MPDNDIKAYAAMVGITARLNIRQGAPRLTAPVAARKLPGATMEVVGYVTGDTFREIDQWYATADDRFFWSGGAQVLQGSGPVPAPADLQAKRRADGTIRPLQPVELEKVFGKFEFREAAGGAIDIDDAWERSNIVALQHELLARVRLQSISVHHKAKAPFQQVFDQIRRRDLADRLVTCAGTYVPRHIGWSSGRPLSSHSWGVAIDLNAEWNGYGKSPAPLGSQGSLVELIPVFAAAGFAWGGHFSTPDGMHFELARTDL